MNAMEARSMAILYMRVMHSVICFERPMYQIPEAWLQRIMKVLRAIPYGRVGMPEIAVSNMAVTLTWHKGLHYVLLAIPRQGKSVYRVLRHPQYGNIESADTIYKAYFGPQFKAKITRYIGKKP